MIDFEQWYKQEIGSENKPEYEAAKWACEYQQAKIDELQARVDKVVHILTYTNHASTPLCNELRDILKGNKDEK